LIRLLKPSNPQKVLVPALDLGVAAQTVAGSCGRWELSPRCWRSGKAGVNFLVARCWRSLGIRILEAGK